MPHRDNTRRYPRNSNHTALAASGDFGRWDAELHFADSTPRLTRRNVKITERRTIEVVERKGGFGSALFSIPVTGADTTKKWSSERATEIEETYE